MNLYTELGCFNKIWTVNERGLIDPILECGAAFAVRLPHSKRSQM